MALNNINLDDKPWSKIAEEARLLIPSFSREWTDHNAHDPGITFLELFAWLEEIQRYRLNRTSTAIRERFFAMSGVKASGPRPALAVVEFTPPQQTVQKYLRIRAGAQLNITAHPDLPYETVRASYLVSSTIFAVETIASGREIDRTAAEQDGAGHFDAFGPDPKAGDELVLTFNRPVNAPRISLAVRVFDQDLPPVTSAPLPVPSVELRWEYSIAKTGARWQTLTVHRDSTAALTLNGFVVFRGPGEDIHRIRARVVTEGYEIPPRLTTIRLNTLEVWQTGRVINRELEPEGTGLPDQQRTLPFLPLRKKHTPIIQVGPSGRLEDWTPVRDFSASEPTSKHYRFDPITREVLFGNGLNGKVPQKNDRIVVKKFRYTLGAQGNLNPGMNWRLAEPLEATNWVGTNLLPATGGEDAESLEDTELRARREFRNSARAVTAEDFETLAKQTPGLRVARAKALPGWNPQYPCVPSPGHITVVVLPAVRPGDLSAREPSSGFRATVTRYLQSARLVATRVHVIGPRFIPVTIAASVTLKRHVAEQDVKQSIEENLRKFFSAQQWPFGRDIFPSEIHQCLMGVTGVAFASQVKINGSPAQLVLGPIELPRLDDLAVEIQGARDA